MVHSWFYARTSMGRKRTRDKHLPQCVYLRHGAYYLVRGAKWIWLGKELQTALQEYGRRLTSASGMPALIDSALISITRRLAKNTCAQYAVIAGKLRSIFAEFSPEQVKPVHVTQVKLAMAETPNMANQSISILRQVFDFALEQQIVESNPAVGVRRFREAKRGRLISRSEYEAVYSHAGARLKIVMDLCYLTAQRVGDVLLTHQDDILEEGIAFRQQKTDVRLIVGWTQDLREAVWRARELPRSGGDYLIPGMHGKPASLGSLRHQWNAACGKAGVVDAHLHDIRAMSLTAANAQGLPAQALAGHTSAAMTARYLRDHATPIVSGPDFGQPPKDTGQP